MSIASALAGAAAEALPDTLPVLVFRTTVNTRGQALLLTPALSELLGHERWSFDLEDRDRVLRIEHALSVRDEVIRLLQRKGFMCAELD
jgi:hypothetical protein